MLELAWHGPGTAAAPWVDWRGCPGGIWHLLGKQKELTGQDPDNLVQQIPYKLLDYFHRHLVFYWMSSQCWEELFQLVLQQPMLPGGHVAHVPGQPAVLSHGLQLGSV